MLTPGPPTSVGLRTASSTSLLVSFSAPSDDGGDPITSYRVQYSQSAGFADSSETQSIYLTNLAGGAPYYVTISGLTTGTVVFVQVSAANTQGYGSDTASTPTSLGPYETSSVPNDVNLAVTSSTMLTASFAEPTSTGGDSIQEYHVEWDTASNFNGIHSSPTYDKGIVVVSAALHSSYTITGLDSTKTYFVRVFAKNAAGLSLAALSTPNSATPSNREPGKPHTIAATTGTVAGEIDLTWARPMIPWHTIPCGGLVTDPAECPTENGASQPSSNGGIEIFEYTISFNERADFSGFDSGEITTTKAEHTIKNLIPGRLYYIRILARNLAGYGQYCSFTDVNCNIPTTLASAVAML
jgi:hypothetical protein